MPCIKLMSASAGTRGGAAAVAGVRILLAFPGAPGWIMGALLFEGWPDIVAAARKSRAAACGVSGRCGRDLGETAGRQARGTEFPESAMSNYTTCRFAGS